MKQYLDLVDDTLSTGTYKPNRTGVDTIAGFSGHYTVDLADGFPLLTTKKMDGYRWNSLIHEVIWYLSGEEHIRTLREETKIWDAWADAEGRLDTAYGRFWRRYPIPEEEAALPGETWPEDAHRWVTVEEDADGTTRRTFDQIAYVIDQLRENPHTRRMVVNAWHPANAAVSTLPPCHYTFVVNVQGGRLNLHLTQRSGDIALGIPFNVAAYALLANVLAQRTGFEVGEFGHTIVDAHVYCGTGDRGAWYEDNLSTLQDRLAAVEERADYLAAREWLESTTPPEADGEEGYDHVPGLLEQLSREPRNRPRIEIADVPLDELTYDDIELVEYDCADGLRFAVAE
ncbi:thymidylate synthase [Halorubrum vacuolatum]|uniref:Thymidylate synthase n=1 Tax=Halorubrum vacuolatum TaxID=63740 RepID=A0A238VYQ0_HALVU|nr:thymidylate synthase [Halorubrum vacuolatum]SNR39234.1 thymidylate synthase [Halorubrum vacuolatum]